MSDEVEPSIWGVDKKGWVFMVINSENIGHLAEAYPDVIYFSATLI